MRVWQEIQAVPRKVDVTRILKKIRVPLPSGGCELEIQTKSGASITQSNRICALKEKNEEICIVSLETKSRFLHLFKMTVVFSNAENVDASKKRRLQHATIRPSRFAANATPALASFSRPFRPASFGNYGVSPQSATLNHCPRGAARLAHAS